MTLNWLRNDPFLTVSFRPIEYEFGNETEPLYNSLLFFHIFSYFWRRNQRMSADWHSNDPFLTVPFQADWRWIWNSVMKASGYKNIWHFRCTFSFSREKSGKLSVSEMTWKWHWNGPRPDTLNLESSNETRDAINQNFHSISF